MKITPTVQKHLNIVKKGVRVKDGKLVYIKDSQPVPPSLDVAVLERYEKRNLVANKNGIFSVVATV